MCNKKGFVFIETIITIVVLTTTLVLLYATYSSALIGEKQRLYYDDIAYIYKTLNIRDILNESLDMVKFRSAFQDKRKTEYMYVFGTESKVYKDNTLIKSAMQTFQFSRLAYVDIDDVSTLKDCVDGKLSGDAICENTLKTIRGYSSSSFLDYLKSIDIPNPRTDQTLPDGYDSLSGDVKGVLIALFYESKSGGDRVPDGSYNSCIQDYVFRHYTVEISPGATEEQIIEAKQKVLDSYYKDENVNFSMHCENAFYNAWVYL